MNSKSTSGCHSVCILDCNCECPLFVVAAAAESPMSCGDASDVSANSTPDVQPAERNGGVVPGPTLQIPALSSLVSEESAGGGE